MRLFNVLIILLVATLTGCGSTPPSYYVQQCFNTTERMSAARWSCIQEANVKEQQDLARQQQQAQIESLRARCDAFGFQRNTPNHSQCMFNLQKQDDNNNFRAAQVNQENARIRQQALRDMNDALKPPQFITPVCPGMLNAKPGQYGPGC